MTPAQAIQRHSNLLTPYEQSEVLEYPEVWYVGNGVRGQRKPTHNHNHGFDDERGDYAIVLNDHMAYRYEVLQTLGKGSFGQVVKCYDYQTNSLLALKIIRNKK